jgi:hypothetical protein
VDYLSKRFGDLVPVRPLANGLWRYRCERIKPSGRVCGNVRDIRRAWARMYKSCVECGREASTQASRRGHQVKRTNFKSERAKFTPEQWKRYYEILRHRTSLEDQKEATEIVLFEASLPPGMCCKHCRAA